MQKISYHFPQSIWKILPFSPDKILLELRDKSNYTASWKILDTREEHIHFSYEPKENSWWLNSTETNPPYFFLHELKQGKTPEISTTKIIDGSGNRALESIAQVSLDEVTEHGCLLSKKDGEVLEKKLPQLSGEKSTSRTPYLYLEDNKHFANFNEIVSLHSKVNAKIQCEYLETDLSVCLSYFSEKESNLSCHLLVLDNEGEVLLNDMIAEQLSGVFTETFCEIDNKIIYVKNENEIHILA